MPTTSRVPSADQASRPTEPSVGSSATRARSTWSPAPTILTAGSPTQLTAYVASSGVTESAATKTCGGQTGRRSTLSVASSTRPTSHPVASHSDP